MHTNDNGLSSFWRKWCTAWNWERENERERNAYIIAKHSDCVCVLCNFVRWIDLATMLTAYLLIPCVDPPKKKNLTFIDFVRVKALATISTYTRPYIRNLCTHWCEPLIVIRMARRNKVTKSVEWNQKRRSKYLNIEKCDIFN